MDGDGDASKMAALSPMATPASRAPSDGDGRGVGQAVPAADAVPPPLAVRHPPLLDRQQLGERGLHDRLVVRALGPLHEQRVCVLRRAEVERPQIVRECLRERR